MKRAQQRRGSRALVASIAGALAVVLALSGCSPEPVAGWSPAAFSTVPGVELVGVQGAGSNAGVGADSDAAQDLAAPQATDSLTESQQRELGLHTGRLRNDEAGVAARFVYVPGVPAFNERVNQDIRAAIATTGKAYAPRVYAPETGRTERGCVPGSSTWPAADVLSRVETGPAGGAGAAVVCDVFGAYGKLIEVRLRTVTGDATAVTSDQVSVMFVDVTGGQLLQIADQWSDSAPVELWRSTIELLRREAGSMSTAPILDPNETQVALASEALHAATTDAEGVLEVTLPSGIASPELEGLGIEATAEPIELRVDAVTVATWASEQYRQLHAELGKPFVGVTAQVNSVPIDCTLIPCVAVTYDDGPGEFTPKLLQTLSDEGARVTFFLMGSRANAHPDLVKQAQVAGHELASHTMTHPDLTTLSVPDAKAQVLNAAAAISAITGVPVTMFRPPYGEVNDKIIAAVGLPSIHWSIDTNDWRKPGQQALIDRSVPVAKPGDIILFHDTHSDTVEVAGTVVRGLRDRGLELVTVTQLFGGHVPGGRVRSR